MLLRKEERVSRSVPTSRKPRPCERETDRARSSWAMRRIGAEVMRGKVVHG
jgi:hypothetical protein